MVYRKEIKQHEENVIGSKQRVNSLAGEGANDERDSLVHIEKVFFSHSVPKIINVKNTKLRKKNSSTIKLALYLLLFVCFETALGFGSYIVNNHSFFLDVTTFETIDNNIEMEEKIIQKDEKVYIYSYNNELKEYLNSFYELYPEYQSFIEYKVVGEGCGDKYISDIAEALESNEKPSIVVYDVDYVERLSDTSVFQSMDDVGINDDMCGEMYPYTLNVTRFDNKNMGLSWQICPGVFLYRMDIATEVFGTTDPDALSEYFASWDGVIKAGEKLKKAGYYLVPDVSCILRCMGDEYDANVVKILLEEGYSKGLTEWTEEWFESFDLDVFGYFGCTWFSEALGNGDTSDCVGVCTVPNAYYWGGSYLGITKVCPNMDIVKLLVYTLCCDPDVMYEMGQNNDYDYPNNQSTIQKMIDNGDEPWNHDVVGTKGVMEIIDDVGKKCTQRKKKSFACYLSDVAINNEEKNYSTNMDAISKDEKRYYSFKVKGIEESKGLQLTYCVHYPSGSSEWVTFKNKLYNNEIATISVTSNTAGMESIDVYASYDNNSDFILIGTMSIQIID